MPHFSLAGDSLEATDADKADTTASMGRISQPFLASEAMWVSKLVMRLDAVRTKQRYPATRRYIAADRVRNLHLWRVIFVVVRTTSHSSKRLGLNLTIVDSCRCPLGLHRVLICLSGDR